MKTFAIVVTLCVAFLAIMNPETSIEWDNLYIILATGFSYLFLLMPTK